jgi:cyanophycinase
VLALVGGDEFNPGNEEQDRVLAQAAGPGPAFVVPTAAARQGPDRAVAHARDWFHQFGLELDELPVLKRGDAMSDKVAARARAGGFFYLVGGDPGLVAQVLRGSSVWRAMFGAWRDGASLAGSSAGAMALCSHTLVRAVWPNRYDAFGSRWVESAQAAAPELTLLGVDERSAAVWRDGTWRAMGPGAVRVIKGKRVRRFESGQTVVGLRSPARRLATQ